MSQNIKNGVSVACRREAFALVTRTLPLPRASELVDSLLVTAVYDTTADCLPVDERARDALTRTTCTLVQWWAETGDSNRRRRAIRRVADRHTAAQAGRRRHRSRDGTNDGAYPRLGRAARAPDHLAEPPSAARQVRGADM
jgi:hypothetical protein